MSNFSVIINSIEIKNLKNVINGKILISKKPDTDSSKILSDIIGIYGQNGSGKTTVIQALDLFKKLAIGMPLWSDMFNCISAGEKSCEIDLCFYLQKDLNQYKAEYNFIICKNNEGNCSFFQETLKYSIYIDGKWTRNTPIFSCNYADAIQVFEPKSRYDALVKKDKENAINLSVAYKLSQERKTSFLFSQELYNILKKSNEVELFEIVSTLTQYAREKLFIIQNSHNGIISLDVMPLAILHSENNKKVIGEIPITLQEPMVTDYNTFEIVSSVTENMNIVISALVPGMSIGIKNHGKQLLKDGLEGIRYELVSKRYNSEFPIRYESEGIKKLLSLLSIIIAMYNDPSVCIAIDELDAGIFETLLGTLLHTIEETGKGQLIFTSHNLRPLEVLSKDNIVFTTTNSSNRYIHLKKVRDENNLRDMYIRALNLGGQEEELSTDFRESEIRRALRKAGKNGN